MLQNSPTSPDTKSFSFRDPKQRGHSDRYRNGPVFTFLRRSGSAYCTVSVKVVVLVTEAASVPVTVTV